MNFEQWFKERTSRFERVLLVTVGAMLVVLLVSQALLTQPVFRQIFSLVERLEGKAYTPAAPSRLPAIHSQLNGKPHQLTLQVVAGDASGLQVRVNGKTAAVFSQSGSVMLEVQDGDDLEVYGTDISQIVEIKVTEVSAGVISPARGKTVTYFGRPETISWVVVGERR
ncbi:MAG: hypothetical protein KGZ41_05290 [Dethiobacter sp.]|jgi:hypothetical protein|nr:hypothetical protein [Dethiobacter sp.]MBS3900349.1 hypothetical protein [Dethiobacter sp.]MBS3983194.1 hypothetical protein [Dethiobacter sp.]MCL4462614.1 hypothetical protein [Bacillota bacterium]MCL5994009.1 hypothetical protein [Bacillota bacterium]